MRSEMKAEPTIEPALLSLADSADFLGLSRDSIYRLLNAGELTAVKFGSKTLITAASLRAFAKSLPPAQFPKPAA